MASQSPMRNTATDSTEAYVPMSQELVHISGYLLKLTRDGKWQRRWFETNGCFLTYYKSKKMEKLLAALNLPQVGEIKIEDDAMFSIELNERVYQLKAANEQEAQKWVDTLKLLKDSEKPKAAATDPAEAANSAESTTSSAEWEKKRAGCCRGLC